MKVEIPVGVPNPQPWAANTGWAAGKEGNSDYKLGQTPSSCANPVMDSIEGKVEEDKRRSQIRPIYNLQWSWAGVSKYQSNKLSNKNLVKFFHYLAIEAFAFFRLQEALEGRIALI